MRPPRGLEYPDGRRFAFTIFDDCDNSTVKNTRPFYDLLERLGFRTTKTVWAIRSPDVHPNWAGSRTLADPEYREFTQELQLRGFEIASHGASMMSSPRDRTRWALEVFAETFGHYPRAFSNHGSNRENIYWFDARFRSGLLRTVYARTVGRHAGRSEGHRRSSPYFWGDLCRAHIDYARGFTFPAIDLFRVHRHVLYRDPGTRYVNYWFSACHAPDVATFNAVLAQQARLARGGLCIVATHAAGLVHHGEVHPETRRLLEQLAGKCGWFVPVSTLLDYLRHHGFGGPIPPRERRMIEWRWLYHALRRGAGR